MTSNPIGQAGFAGVRDGMAHAQAATARIAATAAEGDAARLTEAIVDLQAARQQVEASAKVVQAGNDTLGTLLDVLA